MTHARTKQQSPTPKPELLTSQQGMLSNQEDSRSSPVEVKKYCAMVKAETSAAAESFVSACKGRQRELVIEHLNKLSHILQELQSSGRKGVVSVTEYCNVVSRDANSPAPSSMVDLVSFPRQLVHTDALDLINALQQDAEPNVALTAKNVFEYIVPRIWSS